MIDLHTHILPGVDDGARSMEESVAMARAAAAEGIDVVAATPHVRDDYPTDPMRMEALVRDVADALRAASIPLEVRPGGELALEQLAVLREDELRRFGLAGNPDYLLLEFPYYGWPLELGDQIFRLRVRGVTPVLAHPERNPEVQEAPERLRPLTDQGALVQLTAASLDGRLGRRPKRTALELVDLGLVHLLASDAHAPAVRTIGMSAAARAVGDDATARWLTREVPAAIVEGARLPVAPEPRSRRRGRLLGRLIARG